MKTKIHNLFAIAIMLILSISSCSTAASETSSPIQPTSTIPSSPEPTKTHTSTSVALTPTLVPEEAFIKGITLNYSGNGPKLGTLGAQEVIQKYVIPSGANYVVLVPTCWSTDPNDTNIVCMDEPMKGGEGVAPPPITDQELINATQYLHSVGLRVTLKPSALMFTDITKNFSQLRGTNWSKTEWHIWFDSYIKFITHYAQMAEDHQVDLFVIGCELQPATDYEDEWRRVITAVREIYHGPITYAPNWWQFEASKIKFWDALDFISTNGYGFGFVNKKDPTLEDMKQAWQPYLKRLEEMSQQYGKQVLITEIGAASKENWHTGEVHDWDAAPYDGQDQAKFYTAFFEALKGKPWLKGIILWDIDTHLLQGGANDAGYTFVAKPAEQVVRQYFGGVPISSTPIPNFVENPDETMIVFDENLVDGWRPWYRPEETTFPDFRFPNGHASSYSIQVVLSEYMGLWLIQDSPSLDMSKYKWLEFYIMVGNHQPKHLVVFFEDWTKGLNNNSRMALINNPSYIENGQYESGTWQRVRIPLIDLGITNQQSTGFDILGCAWPCDFDIAADDIYIDDIKLIAGK